MIELPAQCDAEHFPVVVLHNVYSVADAVADPDEFFTELEGDMLEECVRFGNIKCVVTLEVRPSTKHSTSSSRLPVIVACSERLLQATLAFHAQNPH